MLRRVINVPTPTFFNLPAEKRDRIVAAAITEFASNSLDNASIAAIVERADIPRGSFYQYFDGIMDVYKHVFHLIADKKLDYMRSVMANLETMGFFPLMRELNAAGFRFASQNPEMAAIGNRFFQEDQAVRQEILGEFREVSRSFFVPLLARGQERGEIDPSVDVDMASFMLTALNTAAIDHFLEQSSMQDLLDNMDDFIGWAEQMLQILEKGMGTGQG